MRDHKFCSSHKGCIDKRSIVLTGIGSLVGGAIASVPAFGAIIGGLAGKIFGETVRMKTKVFISFDFDNDKALKDFIIGQSKLPDSPFEVADHSLKEAAPEDDWEQKADRAIARSDMVIVMVGKHTHCAQGVLKEVEMARNRNKRVVQVIGYKDGNYTSVPGAGRLYRWNWENLKQLLN